jgi:hypothetical protein
MKYILVALTPISPGLVAGYGLRLIFGTSLPPSVVALLSIAVVLIMIFNLKNAFGT